MNIANEDVSNRAHQDQTDLAGYFPFPDISTTAVPTHQDRKLGAPAASGHLTYSQQHYETSHHLDKAHKGTRNRLH